MNTSVLMATRSVLRQREQWRYVSLLLGCLALVVVLGLQLILLIPTTYTATSAIALRPLTAEQSADNIEMQAHEYSVALGAKEAAAEVVHAITTSGNRPDVSVTATQDSGTSTVRIKTSSTDRDAAVDVANGLAAKAEEIGKDDETAQVIVVVEAGTEGVTSEPPRQALHRRSSCHLWTGAGGWPLPDQGAHLMSRRPVLVLMYHGIDRVPTERDPHAMFVTPAAFRAQIERLLEAGLTPISELVYLAGIRGGPLPRKPVLITFDDGYTGVGEHAAPLLASIGVPSVLYVPAGLLGGTSTWLEPRHQHALMSADEVREVARQGMSVGAHGFDHSDLTGLPDSDVRRHTLETKVALEGVVGEPVRSFAFPYGAHDRRVREATRSAGYQAAFAVHDAVDEFAVRRVDVNALDTMRTFGLKLRRFYPAARSATDRFPAARRFAHDLLRRTPRDGQGDPPVPAGAR